MSSGAIWNFGNSREVTHIWTFLEHKLCLHFAFCSTHNILCHLIDGQCLRIYGALCRHVPCATKRPQVRFPDWHECWKVGWAASLLWHHLSTFGLTAQSPLSCSSWHASSFRCTRIYQERFFIVPLWIPEIGQTWTKTSSQASKLR